MNGDNPHTKRFMDLVSGLERIPAFTRDDMGMPTAAGFFAHNAYVSITLGVYSIMAVVSKTTERGEITGKIRLVDPSVPNILNAVNPDCEDT